ncbi:hypothetical protein QYF61_027039 [Mycteria americana]|uniref:Uncharacterized protein n=1 Tax=Mycteria americana TaxID=33587 RepID=A0AAN7NQA6_MYCAM|nr:hypothetical protein QYF61_027039 [Mycteria americana]
MTPSAWATLIGECAAYKKYGSKKWMQKSTSARSVDHGSRGMEGGALPFSYVAERPLDQMVGWRREWEWNEWAPRDVYCTALKQHQIPINIKAKCVQRQGTEKSYLKREELGENLRLDKNDKKKKHSYALTAWLAKVTQLSEADSPFSVTKQFRPVLIAFCWNLRDLLQRIQNCIADNMKLSGAADRPGGCAVI